MKNFQGLFAIVALLLCCMWLSISYAVAEEICEQHPFLNSPDGFSQNFFYSYGRGWDFTAINNLTISSVQAHSSLAGPDGSTAHIQVKIKDETIASWDQILTTTYTYYTHDALVNADLRTGKAITFFIYGGTSSTPGGAVRNADNYVKLCGTLWEAPPQKAMPWISLLLLSESGKSVLKTWSGPAGFGTFEFITDNDLTEISQLKYIFSDFSCGGVTRNGTITVSLSIPISNKQFSRTVTFSPDFKMTITGGFSISGDFASGTWEALSYGTTCKGIWEASPL